MPTSSGRFRPHSYKSESDSVRSGEDRLTEKGLGYSQLDQFRSHNRGERAKKINIKDVERAIDLLAEKQNLRIAEALADPKIANAYGSLQQAASRLFGTKFYEEVIINYLKGKQVNTVQPGTIGQFLFGNTRDDYGNSTEQCSPLQIGALPVTAENLIGCKRQVWYYDGQIYRQLTEDKYPPLSQADVYIPPNFSGLTAEQRRILSSHGVQSATFYTLDETDKGRQLTSEIPITMAGNIGHYLLQANNGMISQPKMAGRNYGYYEKNENKSYDYGIWVWVIIVVIIIVIIAWIAYSIGKKHGIYGRSTFTSTSWSPNWSVGKGPPY